MSIAELAEQITVLLAPAMPYLRRTDGEINATSVGRESAGGQEQVKVLWPWLQSKLETRPAAMEAVANLFREPRNPDFQAAFRMQLTTILGGDARLASNLARFVRTISVAQPENQAVVQGNGAVAQRKGVAAGAGGAAIGGNAGNVQVMNFGPGANLFLDRPPKPMTAVDRDAALGRYLQYVINRSRYLQLQSIRSGGRLVHIELEHIYICLGATLQRPITTGERWPDKERMLAFRTQPDSQATLTTETITVPIGKVLSRYPRLVVRGDPGSGKSTLLHYLALISARDLAEGSRLVQDKLGLAEPKRLPVLLPLRRFGRYLQVRPDEGTDGHTRLIEFLIESLASERIELPRDFFDSWLTRGDALVLLDGLDEIADPRLRQHVSRLVESFTQTYGRCHYVVTSRIVSYTGAARLGESYAITTLLDFTRDDIARFLDNWHRLIAVAQMGESESAKIHAARQTRRLLHFIDANPRIRDLAVNPLLLTVIAMVHRDRVKLPDRRAELYAEAVEVLLGKWEEAKGVQQIPILQEDQPFDTGDKRLILQDLALYLHEQSRKEIQVADLHRFLHARFQELLGEAHTVEQTVVRFLAMIEERTGLLVARGRGVYVFSHLIFQEYLAALGIAARDDYVAYTLKRASDLWWREVILLEAGYLGTQSKEKTTALIRAIAERKQEPEPYHNLVLAAECLHDVGGNRVQGNLRQEVQQRLRADLEAPPPLFVRWFRKARIKNWIEQRAQAMEALVRIGAGFWTMPYGEPEWVKIPPGTGWMGSNHGRANERPLHQIKLDAFLIARVPITNAQYHLFLQATGHRAPQYWREDRPPRGLESHPVTYVSWHDALAYCLWLSRETGKPVSLPSEAQWERAARGDKDQREYPWGDRFEATWCNSGALELGATTPVGIFPEGASQFGCLDMVGNIWEWTSSLMGDYPYPKRVSARQAREDLTARGDRVLRGGAFDYDPVLMRCACRSGGNPDGLSPVVGFRVMASCFD